MRAFALGIVICGLLSVLVCQTLNATNITINNVTLLPNSTNLATNTTNLGAGNSTSAQPVNNTAVNNTLPANASNSSSNATGGNETNAVLASPSSNNTSTSNATNVAAANPNSTSANNATSPNNTSASNATASNATSPISNSTVLSNNPSDNTTNLSNTTVPLNNPTNLNISNVFNDALTQKYLNGNFLKTSPSLITELATNNSKCFSDIREVVGYFSDLEQALLLNAARANLASDRCFDCSVYLKGLPLAFDLQMNVLASQIGSSQKKRRDALKCLTFPGLYTLEKPLKDSINQGLAAYLYVQGESNVCRANFLKDVGTILLQRRRFLCATLDDMNKMAVKNQNNFIVGFKWTDDEAALVTASMFTLTHCVTKERDLLPQYVQNIFSTLTLSKNCTGTQTQDVLPPPVIMPTVPVFPLSNSSVPSGRLLNERFLQNAVANSTNLTFLIPPVFVPHFDPNNPEGLLLPINNTIPLNNTPSLVSDNVSAINNTNLNSSLVNSTGVINNTTSNSSLVSNITSASNNTLNNTGGNSTNPRMLQADSTNITSTNITSTNITSANTTSANTTSANTTSENTTSANTPSTNITSANTTSANTTSANTTSANNTSPITPSTSTNIFNIFNIFPAQSNQVNPNFNLTLFVGNTTTPVLIRNLLQYNSTDSNIYKSIVQSISLAAGAQREPYNSLAGNLNNLLLPDYEYNCFAGGPISILANINNSTAIQNHFLNTQCRPQQNMSLVISNGLMTCDNCSENLLLNNITYLVPSKVPRDYLLSSSCLYGVRVIFAYWLDSTGIPLVSYQEGSNNLDANCLSRSFSCSQELTNDPICPLNKLNANCRNYVTKACRGTLLSYIGNVTYFKNNNFILPKACNLANVNGKLSELNLSCLRWIHNRFFTASVNFQPVNLVDFDRILYTADLGLTRLLQDAPVVTNNPGSNFEIIPSNQDPTRKDKFSQFFSNLNLTRASISVDGANQTVNASSVLPSYVDSMQNYTSADVITTPQVGSEAPFPSPVYIPPNKNLVSKGDFISPKNLLNLFLTVTVTLFLNILIN